MTSGKPGSAYQPSPDTEIRLARWRRLASAGVPVAEIAAALGMARRSLDRTVCRARAAGHPDAIYHPSNVPPGEGFGHLRDGNIRARRIQRRANERPTP